MGTLSVLAQTQQIPRDKSQNLRLYCITPLCFIYFALQHTVISVRVFIIHLMTCLLSRLCLLSNEKVSAHHSSCFVHEGQEVSVIVTFIIFSDTLSVFFCVCCPLSLTHPFILKLPGWFITGWTNNLCCHFYEGYCQLIIILSSSPLLTISLENNPYLLPPFNFNFNFINVKGRNGSCILSSLVLFHFAVPMGTTSPQAVYR